MWSGAPQLSNTHLKYLLAKQTELQLGLTTRKDALMRLNPDESESEINELMAEIDAENTVQEQPLHAPETQAKEAVQSEEG